MPKVLRPKSFILACVAFIIISLSGYWLKCQMGIGFFENYSLSKYIPFKYLTPNNVIDDPSLGIILDDSFDSFSLFGNWTNLWMREKGRVSKKHDSHGLNNSRCLMIKSSSKGSWSSSHKKYVRVKEGDVFRFKVFVKLSGDELSAYSGVAAFDRKKQVISWNYITAMTSEVGEWITLEKKITIPEGIAYIRFRLVGKGIGEFRFDNVCFEKISSWQ